MTGYDLTISPDVLAARIALTEGLQHIREMMATAIRGDGGPVRAGEAGTGTGSGGGAGLPRTRQRPHTNEAPGARTAGPGANTRPVDGRGSAPHDESIIDKIGHLPGG